MQVYSAVARCLVDLGLSTMFGVMGTGNMLSVGAFVREHGGRFVPSAHEGGGVAMADGFWRIAGGVGVATATQGPGLTNALTALTEAVRNRSSLVLLTSESPDQRGHVQHFDARTAVSATGAGFERVWRADTVVRDVTLAVRRSIAERVPVVLSMPYDLLLAEAEYAAPSPLSEVELSRRDVGVSASEAELEDVAAQLLSANRPLIVAGRGAVEAGARDVLVALAELTGASLATTLLAKGFFRGHERDLGIFGTLSAEHALGRFAAADVVLAVGASLNMYTCVEGDLVRGKRVTQIESDPARSGIFHTPDVLLVGDAAGVAAALVAKLQEAGAEPVAVSGPAAAAAAVVVADEVGPLTADEAVAVLNQTLPADRILVTDSGLCCVSAWGGLDVLTPEDFFHTCAFGSIGLGVPAGIGASVASPDRLTVTVTGDGGLAMCYSELITAVREQANVVFIVMNDECYGSEYVQLVELGVSAELSFLQWPGFAAVASAMGIRSVRAGNAGELRAAVAQVGQEPGPMLIEILTTVTR